MSVAENDLIDRYFSNIRYGALSTFSGHQSQSSKLNLKPALKSAEILKPLVLGIGDDAAVLDLQALAQNKQHLVVSTDSFVEGTHFLPETEPFSVGYKSLIVNLSDLAAMGAEPLGFTLNISLPSIDDDWLDQFAKGLEKAAQKYSVSLIGGDTTKGEKNIGIQIFGLANQPWYRHTAKAGDLLVVTGTLGDARRGFHLTQNEQLQLAEVDREWLLKRFHFPTPRFLAQRSITSPKMINFRMSAMDISDGLLQDLEKLCKASHTTASVDFQKLPISKALSNSCTDQVDALCQALVGGEDYELLLSIAPENFKHLESLCNVLNIQLTKIGQLHESQTADDLTDSHLVEYLNLDSLTIKRLRSAGYQHF